MHKEMEIIFSSSWTSFGTPQVEIEESTVESKEENEWKVIPRTKMDSSMLAAVRGFLLTTFVSSANVSLVPHEQGSYSRDIDGLRTSLSADSALLYGKEFTVDSTMTVMSDPTMVARDDRNIRPASNSDKLLHKENSRRRPLAVAVGFDQLEDSNGRTVVITPTTDSFDPPYTSFSNRSFGTKHGQHSSLRGRSVSAEYPSARSVASMHRKQTPLRGRLAPSISHIPELAVDSNHEG